MKKELSAASSIPSTSLNTPTTITITEEELVDRFLKKDICNQCGVSNDNIRKRGNAWDAPRLCTLCYGQEERLAAANTPTITTTEKKLVDWYLGKDICNQCGVSNDNIRKRGNAWDSPRLCTLCYEREERLAVANTLTTITIATAEYRTPKILIKQKWERAQTVFNLIT
ncbi:unnamed protein product [Rhizophagus irregularis]|uniref:Uncharacterized protein n=1 Tax=Rhizophagus irregularis TaxID=588596 RepID=A0A2I1G5S0_9GLOM|nr:hypothetical protein RhiirA4_455709 [Rhizophagus irregularis]CAB4438961.1 unnamed protein product [Rhizophagus irregularis]